MWPWLNKLFEDPAKKLQEGIKSIFFGFTILEIIGLWVLELGSLNTSILGLYKPQVTPGKVILTIFICLVGTAVIAVLNYIWCLFIYMLLSFFQDIHGINQFYVWNKERLIKLDTEYDKEYDKSLAETRAYFDALKEHEVNKS